MGPKKGVISQSVKDVIQSLVDDDLVLKDKIGTSVNTSPLCYAFFLKRIKKIVPILIEIITLLDHIPLTSFFHNEQ